MGNKLNCCATTENTTDQETPTEDFCLSSLQTPTEEHTADQNKLLQERTAWQAKSTGAPGDDTLVMRVLVFNVSAGSGYNSANDTQLQAGIDNVLDQDDCRYSIDTFEFPVLANDNVTSKKQEQFQARGMDPVSRFYTEKKEAIVFMNQKAQSVLVLNELLSFFNIISSRMSVYVSTPIHPSNISLLVVSWHGPYSGLTDNIKQAIFTQLVLFVENLRQTYNADVAMIGGDFNLPKEVAKLLVANMMTKKDIPPAMVCDLEVEQKRKDVIDYLVVWSAQCEVGYIGTQLFLPSHGIPPKAQPGLWPFDHPVLLYQLQITKVTAHEAE